MTEHHSLVEKKRSQRGDFIALPVAKDVFEKRAQVRDLRSLAIRDQHADRHQATIRSAQGADKATKFAEQNVRRARERCLGIPVFVLRSVLG